MVNIFINILLYKVYKNKVFIIRGIFRDNMLLENTICKEDKLEEINAILYKKANLDIFKLAFFLLRKYINSIIAYNHYK